MNYEKPNLVAPLESIKFPEHLRDLEKLPYATVTEKDDFNPDAISLRREADVNLFGSNMTEMAKQIDAFLAANCVSDEVNLAALRASMIAAVKGMLADFKAEAAMVMIRLHEPTKDFEVPRWHRDNSFRSEAREGKKYKKVYTLKGAPTRFATVTNKEEFRRLDKDDRDNNTKHHNGEISPAEYDEISMRIRKELVKFSEELPELAPNESRIYEIGGDEMILHSEPDIKESRIFMAVMVGSKEEIEEAQECVQR